MDQKWYGAIEIVLSFVVVFGLGFQQLWSLSRMRKKDQLEAERKKREGETK